MTFGRTHLTRSWKCRVAKSVVRKRREELRPDDLSAWETREADQVRCQVAVPGGVELATSTLGICNRRPRWYPTKELHSEYSEKEITFACNELGTV